MKELITSGKLFPFGCEKKNLTLRKGEQITHIINFVLKYNSWFLLRNNVVLEDPNGKAVGFRSLFFQDKGCLINPQALRLDPELKGQGLGMHFMQLVKNKLQSGVNKSSHF